MSNVTVDVFAEPGAFDTANSEISLLVIQPILPAIVDDRGSHITRAKTTAITIQAVSESEIARPAIRRSTQIT